MLNPIKRHIALQPTSREHHHTLLFCWKIRTALSKNVAIQRIINYINWFWKNSLKPHFKFEEEHLFTILPQENELYKQVIFEHQQIEQLITNKNKLTKEQLKAIDTAIVAHVRFEERILFNLIQEKANEEQLKQIENLSINYFTDDWEDEFWK